jgi:hypothetical protein
LWFAPLAAVADRRSVMSLAAEESGRVVVDVIVEELHAISLAAEKINRVVVVLVEGPRIVSLAAG